MSEIEELGRAYGSRRYARDLLEAVYSQNRLQLQTRTWWSTPYELEALENEQANQQSDAEYSVHFSLKGMFK